MQKFCATFLLIGLLANYEALPQTSWSRPISNGQGQLTRERRQFPFGEWIPLNKPCPACRTLVDPLDIAQRAVHIGLTPPRPPTVTRQVHGEGNFFSRDESSILSVPPPPPGTLRHGSNGNFQNFRVQEFSQQFNNHVPVLNQQIFPQSQQVQFLQQPFAPNQNVLVNSNQQVIPVLNNQNTLFGLENRGKQTLNSGKVPNLNDDLKNQKLTENIVLQQNQSGRKLPFSSKSAPFAAQQQQQLHQQTFIHQPQQQSFVQHQQQQVFSQQQQQKAFAQQPQQQALVQQRPLQQKQSLNFDSILTPPPVSNTTAQRIVIPGLDKEEVQLLYVPVETLKHKGTLQQQQQLLTQQQQQNVQFPNRQISQLQSTKNVRLTDDTIATTSTTKLLPGSFVTSQRETLSTIKVSAPQPFSTASTPSTVFFQSLPLQQTPEPFVSATPIISTPSPFVTQSPFVNSSPFTQTFSTLSPTTLSHFPTFQNSVQFKQPETQFRTTPKTLISEEGLREEIITGKPQFESLEVHQLPFTQDQSHILLAKGQQRERNPIQTTSQIQTNPPENQFQNQQLLLKSQQEQQLLLQQQKEKELREEYLLKERHQKELESQRLLELQRLKELEQQAFLLKQKKQQELEEQKLLEEQKQKKLEQTLLQQKRQKELEEEKLLQQRQRELEQQKFLQQQRQKEIERERYLQQQRKKELEKERFLQLQRQKELEQERFLQLQRQKELEQERFLQQQRQKELEQERFLKQQREKELEKERFLQQQRQKELEQERFLQHQRQLKEEQERFLQQQRQKELEQERFLQQQRQKELEQEKFLQQQKQKEKEVEQERYLQQQRQKEMEEQLKINRLKELDEKRLLQQRQREQEEQRLLLLQQQKEIEEQKLLQEQQQRLRQQQDEQQNLLLQQNLQRQNLENAQKAENFQFTQQQELNKHTVEEPKKHVFSETDNSDLIPQLEKETESESLIPHQPPLSVFFKGDDDKRHPQIVDVLRELRNSQTIIVLDQYFEAMPKVFVGPAGLKSPLGYGKFELPYLSNIDNTMEVKIDRLPFFVAPLNFVPPPGYSKIPFPSPHVGSVVISSESNPIMNLKPTESTSFGENDDVKNFDAVGPELPGLINSLEKETATTIKPTTSSLPQTTAQLRNRRPNNSLYRSRKPTSRVRSTTTAKPEEITQKPQKEELEGEFRKPFNRFLKRRRPTTTTTTTESPQEKEAEVKQYSFQVQHRKRTRLQPNKAVVEQRLNHQKENQGFDKTPSRDQSHVDFQFNPNKYKIQSHDEKFKEQNLRIPEYGDINNIQTFEDGPIPTGSAKSITQEVYRPNNLRITNTERQGHSQIKFLPKVDTIQSSEKIDQPKPTTFLEDSEVNPTALYVETTAGRIGASDYLTLAPKSDSNGNIISTITPPNLHKPENSHVQESSPITFEQQQHSSTENALLDDRFTVAFAEISKHYNIPSPQETPKRYEAKYNDVRPSSEISHNLQAPYAESLFQEQQQPQGLVTLEEIKPTNSITNLENINVPVTTSNEGFSDHFENENQNKQNFSGIINEVNQTAFGIFDNQQHITDYKVKSQDTSSFVTETEQPVANVENFYTTSSPTSPLEQFYFTSEQVPIEGYITVNNKSKNEENYYPATIRVSAEVGPTLNYGQEIITRNENLNNDNLPKIEDYSQTTKEISSTTQGLKFSNPSIVKVRTRVRGRQRGSVNFAASQLTTSAPVVRTKSKNQFDESDVEHITKPNNLRNYNPVKISKFNGLRGLKKPTASITNYAQTTEATTEYDQRTNIYTIRPQRRPSNPSTVSTKRIRRPTSPFPTSETSTEGFGISTSPIYSQEGIYNQEYPSSGLSNDVYYDNSNSSPIRKKFKNNQILYGEQSPLKSIAIPSYSSTTYSPLVQNNPATLEVNSPTLQESYSQIDETIGHLPQDETPQPSSERYTDLSFSFSKSGIDISDIVLTTIRTPAEEEESSETEIHKKFQESKKAVDPDLEKKNGRRRVRVRVHKRPHENFETAESQNLRTVANVLVPPTSTYKPNDENSFHQLAKNANSPFGVRSREYFRKKLNLTHLAEIDVAKSRKDSVEKKTDENSSEEDSGEGALVEHRVRENFGKIQRKENERNGDYPTKNIPSGLNNEKFPRTKVRGFIRKIKKHGGPRKNFTTPIFSTDDDDDDGEVKQENIESHTRQHVKVNYGGSHQNGRFNGTRHRTIVKYIKKNRFRTYENESHERENENEKEKGEQSHKVTESHSILVNEEANHETDIHTTQRTEPQSNKKDLTSELDVVSTTLRSEAQHTQEVISDVIQSQTTEQSKVIENLEDNNRKIENTDLNVYSTEQYQPLHNQTSDTIQGKIQTTEQTQRPETDQTEAVYIPTTQYVEAEKVSTSEESSQINEEFPEKETEASRLQSSTQTTELKITNKAKPFHSFRPFYQRNPSSGFIRTREPLSSTTEQIRPEPNDRRYGLTRPKYEKNSSRKEEKSEDKKIPEFSERNAAAKNSFTPEIRKYSKIKNRENSFSSFSKSRYTTPDIVETISETSEKDEGKFTEKQPETTLAYIEKATKNEPEFDVSTNVEHISTEAKTTQTFAASTETIETTNDEHTTDVHINPTALPTEAKASIEEEEEEEENEKELIAEEVSVSTEGRNVLPTSLLEISDSEVKLITTETATEIPIATEKIEAPDLGTQPNLYIFGKDTFSFDEAEKFTGTKNRAYVRNITADILENTAHFSAPGIDKQNDIQTESISNNTSTTTDINSKIGGNEKTEETATEVRSVETTTVFPSSKKAVSTETVTKPKIAKLVKTSTTTKISHETEICYRGKCIRTKSENPDEDVKLLVDSANISLEKNKT